MKKYFYLFVLLCFVFCSKEETQLPDTNPTLPPIEVVEPEAPVVSSIIDSTEAYKTYSGAILKTFAGLSTDIALDYDFQNIEITKVFFETTDENQQPIIGSGVIMIPKTETPLGIVSLQHSTIEDNSEAPSYSALGRNEFTIGSIIASSGFITILSDYIGYGINNTQRHPYEHKASLANNTYDMLLAAEAFLVQQEIDFPENLYLIGYSEGGGSTLALHEKIELENTFTITQSFVGGGAYDKTLFLELILNKDEDLEFLGSYLWVLDVYNKFYPTLQKDWNQYINEPYATQLNTLETINGPVPEDLINLNPTSLFTEEFRSGINDSTNIAILDVMADNNLTNWTPKAPILFFHGALDNFVFPIITLNTFSNFKEKGSEVEYIQFEDKNHLDAAIPFFFESLSRMRQNTP